MVRRIVRLGVGGVVGITTIGVMPNISGSPAVVNLKGKAVQGIGEVGKKLPVLGRIKGTTVVLKSTGDLREAGKMFSTIKKKRRRFKI